VVPVEASHEITPAANRCSGWATQTVGAVARHGKDRGGLGFGSRFADPNMGTTGDVVPNADLRRCSTSSSRCSGAILEDRWRRR